VAWRKNSLRIRTGTDEGGEKSSSGEKNSRGPLRSLSLTRKVSNRNSNPNSATVAPAAADPRVVRTAPPVLGFGGAMSFRWQIWSKVQRSPSEQTDTPAPPAVGRLRTARKSEPDIKTSFVETEAKPQRMGFLFKKKKS